MYKIQVRVIDETGPANFMLWDKDVYKLINRKAIQLRENQLKVIVLII